MPTGLITEYHAGSGVGLIQVDNQADPTFLGFHKSDCSQRLQNKLNGDIPPGNQLHVSFDPGTESDPDDPGTPLPIAINVDLTGADAQDFGTSNRVEAIMAAATRAGAAPGAPPPPSPAKGSKPRR